MLIDIQKLDRALDRTLEAAVDVTLWPRLIEDVREATSAFGVNILPIHGIFRGGVLSTESLGPALEGYFAGGWNHNEWRVRGIPRLQRTGSVLEQTYTTREQFETEDYYRDQSRYGIGRTCIVNFGTGGNILCFTLHRRLDEEPFGVEEEAIFRSMRQRLMMSSQIMQALDASKIDGMSDAFEMTRTPAIFFDRNGRVTKVNDAARALLGPDLQISADMLKCRLREETVQVRRRIEAVASGAWLMPAEANFITVSRGEKRPLVLKIQRLGGNLGDIFSNSVGVCLIEDLEQQPVSHRDVVAKSLGLTRKQAELAILLSEGKSLREIAEQTGISYETARSHLRAIFERTDVKRQSELVALVTRTRA